MKSSRQLSGLDSERKWIDEHTEYYHNSHHQELVKKNIEIRYRAQALIFKLNRVLPGED